MSGAELEARQRAHVLYTWTAQNAATPVDIVRGEGAVFFDRAGRRWLDFESQVFNCNAGHNQQGIVEAVQRQAGELACAHPAAVFEAKARLGELLAEITPEGMEHFFLCLSGAEAVENAYKIARMVTGRQKVIARRQSYHGASMGALSLTGDPRRWPLEPGLWGVVRAEDPDCHRCPFGLSRPTCQVRCASHIERILQMENPDTVAAVFLEGVSGAAGGFIPPDEYWPMVREICDRYGVLLVSDEVLSGFGRTGEWFAVDHWGVTPDLMTMAKGVTSGYAPLGVLGMSEAIARRFDDETLWAGLTSYAHPLSCAAAVATIELYQREGLVQRSKEMGQRLAERLAELKARHSVIADVRSLGLWGTIELHDPATGDPLTPYAQKPEPGTGAARLGAGLRSRGLHIAYKWSYLFIAPPLVITEAELDEGMAAIDAALTEAF